MVLIELFVTGVIAVDANPVHGAAVTNLQFADDRDIIFTLAGDDTRTAAGAHIKIDRHAPLIFPFERRMTIK